MTKTPPAQRVESANALNINQLFDQHCPDAKKHLQSQIANALSSIHKDGNPLLQTLYHDAATLTTSQLNLCLDLVEHTSANDYKNSETGWSRSKKRREMKLPDLRYLLLLEASPATAAAAGGPEDALTGLAGFISFMITYEDGHEVIYIYEIHFHPRYQGKGIGKVLMQVVETVGSGVGVRKAMLTVFRSNQRAVEWYGRLGYGVDEFSPEVRRLRGGKVKEPGYVILSKRLRGAGR